MVAKFRKVPVVIEAAQVPLTEEAKDAQAWDELELWLDGMTGRSYEVNPFNVQLHQHRAGVAITTLEGVMHADPGDWIIKGVSGEFYLCKPAIFAATYEPVGDEDSGDSSDAVVDSDNDNVPESTDH